MSGPTEAKRRAGNAGGRPVAGRRIERSERPVPPTPPGLGTAGQEAWTRLWTAGDWLNARAHYEPMRILAAAYDEIETYRALIRRHPTVKGAAGQTRLNPASAAIRQAEASVRAWMRELGFFARREEPDGEAGVDEFLFRGAEPPS